MARKGLRITTINAFPLQAFQADVVKDGAYRPPWPDAERCADSEALIKVVETLCPEQDTVTISTVPGTYCGWSTTTTRAMRSLPPGVDSPQ